MLSHKKIMIFNCAGLGDAVIFTPTLRKLKEMFPTCEILFVTNPFNVDALQGLPYLKQVYALGRKDTMAKLRLLPALFQQDYIVFTTWQPQLVTAAQWFRVPHISGVAREKHRSEKVFKPAIRKWVLSTPEYAATVVAAELGRALGVSLDIDEEQLDVALPSATDRDTVEKLLREENGKAKQPYICLAPFTGVKEKNWPFSYVVELKKRLLDEWGLPVVLLGGKLDSAEAAGYGQGNLVGKTTLLQMVEVIKRALLFIGPDSGPMHVAAAVGTPSIALFSKDVPSRWAPRKNCKAVSLGLPCSPCGDEQARVCPTVQCNVGITAEMVAKAVREELAHR